MSSHTTFPLAPHTNLSHLCITVASIIGGGILLHDTFPTSTLFVGAVALLTAFVLTTYVIGPRTDTDTPPVLDVWLAATGSYLLALALWPHPLQVIAFTLTVFLMYNALAGRITALTTDPDTETDTDAPTNT